MAVNRGAEMLQRIIFEPDGRKLHLSIGSCPSSGRSLKELALRALLE